jgi:hypothetical protein
VPVWKYRCVDEVPPTPCYEPGSALHLQQWEALWARASALGRKRFRAGVFRYRSVEDSERGAIEECTDPVERR